MSRFAGLFSARTLATGSKSMTALDERNALDDALRGAARIMNDEVEQADVDLSKGTSPFHKLGQATTLFLRAVLGFEKEMMEQTAAKLSEAEESALEHYRRAQRDPTQTHQSRIYPPGAEYALCQAECQLMLAVVGILNESLMEALKGFQRMRKAFATLHEIVEAEKTYLASHSPLTDGSSSSSSSSVNTAASNSTSTKEVPAYSSNVTTPDEIEPDFKDALEEFAEAVTPQVYQGHIDLFSFAHLDLQSDHLSKDVSSAALGSEDEIDFRTITSDDIDLFIHSGASLCHGLLQLLLSMVPPAFSKVLSFFSFRGDRETGLKELWMASRFKENINGALAGMILLTFHNAAIGLCDILAPESLPTIRLGALLSELRRTYPKSKLWLLEEARMQAASRKLPLAIQTLSSGSPSPLKQIEALRLFEKSMSNLHLHNYAETAELFIACCKLNNWSHALYYYIAGICHVELYRTALISPSTSAAERDHHATQAALYLRKVPTKGGKKRFMAKQLPFDAFVQRKLSKWEARLTKLKKRFPDANLADAVGVSPAVEMSYFWSGLIRQSESELATSLERLELGREVAMRPELANMEKVPAEEGAANEDPDETSMRLTLQASCLRFMGRINEAKVFLEREVIGKFTVEGIKAQANSADGVGANLVDLWGLPVAHYERAACLWDEAETGSRGDEQERMGLLSECAKELEVVSKWEAFELNARVGLKVTTGRETLRKAGLKVV